MDDFAFTSTAMVIRPFLAAIVVGLVGCAGDGDGGSNRGRGAGNGGDGGGGTRAGTLGVDNPTGGATTGGTTPEQREVGMVGEGDECAGVTERAKTVYRPVDIIWALDNSGSMIEEANGLQMNMNAFASFITMAKIDVRVIVISEAGPPLAIYPDPMGGFDTVMGVCVPPPLGSGTCPEDSKPPGYLHVMQHVDSNDALHQITQTYPQWKDVLRRNSLKYLAVVTDDTADSPDSFVSSLQTLDIGPPNMFQDWKFFGVFCTGAPGCAVSPTGSQMLGIPCVAVGEPYLQLVNMTGGVAGDLCAANQNFAGVSEKLAQSVIESIEIACDWEIPPPPADQVFDPTRINVNYTPPGGTAEPLYFVEDAANCVDEGWYYDDKKSPTRVVACPKTCSRIKTDRDGQIDIVFGCLTILTPG